MTKEKLEAELKKLGLKKRWLSDKSGYWYEKKFNFLGQKLAFIVEIDMEKLFLDGFENCDALSFPFSLKEIHKIIKIIDKL